MTTCSAIEKEWNLFFTAKILSKKDYVGADYEVIANSMTGTFLFQKIV